MLPSLQQDMTLYSLVAIAHRWSGCSRGELTSTRLFGSSCAGLRHDFPSHLDEFSLRTRFEYGSSSQMAQQATVLPYFLQFRADEVRAEALALMRGKTVERLKFVLGLPAGPSGASMPLGLCEECIREDICSHGFAYWHRQHQLPGVFTCQRHGVTLVQSKIRIEGIGRSRFLLPNDPELSSSNTVSLRESQFSILRRISTLSGNALDGLLPGGFSPQVLLATYRHGLKQQGLLTNCGQARAEAFVKWIRDRYSPIADLEPFNRIVSERSAEGMLRLVRKPRGHFHTASHLILIDALFGDWERFVSVYAWEHQMELPFLHQEDVDGGCLPVPNERDELVAELARRHRSGEGSVSALSRELGIDVNTATRWLGKLGLLDVPKRPRVLTKELRAEIVHAIKRGEPLKQIAKSLGLSRATIDRVCAETQGLHEIWKNASRDKRRAEERAKLEALIGSKPDITLAALRQTRNSGYCWLCRHDKGWLKSKMQIKVVHRRARVVKRKPRVNWEERDRECMAALKSLELVFQFQCGDRLAPMAVLRKIPRLSFTPRLERLPESRKLVATILARERTRREQR